MSCGTLKWHLVSPERKTLSGKEVATISGRLCAGLYVGVVVLVSSK